MGRKIKSIEDCADCLCRVCARSVHNDSYNHKVDYDKEFECSPCSMCNVFREIIETEDDCNRFLPDERFSK